MKRYLMALSLAIAAASLPAGVISEVVDRVVAVVGDQVITLYELDQAYENDALGITKPNPLNPVAEINEDVTRAEYLERMVEALLIEQEVERQGININALEIEKAIEKQKKKLRITDEQFQQLLAREGITMEMYRKKVRQDLVTIRLLGQEVRSTVEISDDEIMTYYRQNSKDFVEQDRVHVSRISVGLLAEESMQEKEKLMSIMLSLRQRAVGGEDFADLAREVSKAGRPAEGGDMGWFNLNELKAGYASVLETLGRGEVSEPFELDGAYHILRANDWEKGLSMPVEQVRDQIRETLYQKEVKEKYNQWLERLKARSHVEIRL